MPTCANAGAVCDDEVVIDDDPLVTDPVVRRSVCWSGELPTIPPLYQQLVIAGRAMRRRTPPTKNGRAPAAGLDPVSLLVPSTTAWLLWQFLIENHSRDRVDGVALRSAFLGKYPRVRPNTYQMALSRLCSLHLLASTRQGKYSSYKVVAG